MITDFLRYIKTERRYSAHTIEAYTLDLKTFEQFLTLHYANCTLTEVNREMLRAFIIELKSQRLNNRSINRKLSSLRSFYNFLLKKQHIGHNPLSTIKTLKTAKNIPEFVPEALIESLTFEKIPETFEAIRDQLIFELLYQTGMRRAEICTLRDQDIDFSSLLIKVRGKRNKERLIPFTIGLGKLIKSYYKMRNSYLRSEMFDSTIVTNKGQKCYPGLIYRSIHQQLSSISTLSKTSPHVLRHTFATHLLNSGADLMAIKELLGHSSLEATQVYTHSTIEQLKKIHKQAHPKG
ncbi:MAG: tyrosine-type recombinase/integrase [Bacteroidetes bacterium]|nr:tyrosine-type recombinase/integrase [Bacteroidota bacterium]